MPPGMEVIQPARLSFLALYNPFLGRTDETLHDQVVFYYPASAQKTKKASGRTAEEIEDAVREERNERLRQIGLAQGMVEFAKAFSDGEAVDAIDSERSRVVLHELEPGWWILASVELTHLRNTPGHSRSKSDAAADDQPNEYSAREVAAQGLLLKNLLRANAVFLLHHAPSLADLYVKLTRTKFCAVLEKYWNRFARDWDVFLNGNPAVDIYDGIKLAAGGELGIGVGEEEWGSGEREVLEGFIGRTDGLVDMIVSRFGDLQDDATPVKERIKQLPWLGQGVPPDAADGVIFSGVGAITRPLVRSVSAWLELIYKQGIAAYGVADNPQSTRRKRRPKVETADKPTDSGATTPTRSNHRRGRSSGTFMVPRQSNEPEGSQTPPPIVRAANSSLEVATANVDKKNTKDEPSETATDKTATAAAPNPEQPSSPGSPSKPPQAFDSDTLLKYMTLGVYGSSWGIQPRARSPSSSHLTPPRARSITGVRSPLGQTDDDDTPFPPKPLRFIAPKPQVDADDAARALDVEDGCFLIGLRGDLSLEDDAPEEEEPGTTSNTDPEASSLSVKPQRESSNWNRRIIVRSLYVQRHRTSRGRPDVSDPPASTFFDRHRVVVYARRPFLFAFVFDAKTPTLSYTALYRALHHQLGPLRKPLLQSTTAANAAARLADALRSPRAAISGPSPSAPPPTPDSEHPIYALLYDPATLTVLASLPNIPEPGTPAAEGFLSRGGSPARGGGLSTIAWTRGDALGTHAHIIAAVVDTKGRRAEMERMSQTNRGWWIVWLRLMAGKDVGKDKDNEGEGTSPHATPREAFLVRKAIDPSGSQGAKKGFGFGSPSKNVAGREGMGRIVEGIGVDARRYVEGLLSLNR